MKTGIQVSSFRPVLKTQEQVKSAFEKMRAMGCEYVQLQWIDPAVPADFIAGCMRECGIVSVGLQDFYELIRENPGYYLELNRATGGEWVCVSRIPERLKKSGGAEAFAAELEQFQKELEPLGQRLCFHPVSNDFALIGGVEPVEYLFENLPWLSFCLDLYHLDRCCDDMPGFIRRFGSRICMVHIKEGQKMPDGTEILVPPGQGDMDWTGVFEACRDAGVSYAFAEQETWQGDPFQRLKEGFDWTKRQVRN